MEIAPHIHWIEGVKGNVYACFDHDRVTLIGTGRSSIDRIDLIFNYLARHNYYLANLHKIIITHADPDVAGNIAEIQTEIRVPIYASPKTKEFLAAGQLPAHSDNKLRNRLGKFPAIEPDTIVTLAHSEQLPILGGFYVYHTTGFIPGHLTLFNPTAGLLFSGDLFQTKEGLLQSATTNGTMNTHMTHASIRQLLALCPAVFAPSQDPPLNTHTAAQLVNLYPNEATD